MLSVRFGPRLHCPTTPLFTHPVHLVRSQTHLANLRSGNWEIRDYGSIGSIFVILFDCRTWIKPPATRLLSSGALLLLVKLVHHQREERVRLGAFLSQIEPFLCRQEKRGGGLRIGAPGRGFDTLDRARPKAFTLPHERRLSPIFRSTKRAVEQNRSPASKKSVPLGWLVVPADGRPSPRLLTRFGRPHSESANAPREHAPRPAIQDAVETNPSLRRRRHHASKPPAAKMRPGNPAPAMGAGTAAVPVPCMETKPRSKLHGLVAVH